MIIFSLMHSGMFYICHIHDEAEFFLSDRHPISFVPLKRDTPLYHALNQRIQTQCLVGLEIEKEQLEKHIEEEHVYFQLSSPSLFCTFLSLNHRNVKPFAINHILTQEAHSILYSLYIHQGIDAVKKILGEISRGETGYQLTTNSYSELSNIPIIELESWAHRRIAREIKKSYSFQTAETRSSQSFDFSASMKQLLSNPTTITSIFFISLISSAIATTTIKNNSFAPIQTNGLLLMPNNAVFQAGQYKNRHEIIGREHQFFDSSVFAELHTREITELDFAKIEKTLNTPECQYNFQEANIVQLLEANFEFMIGYSDMTHSKDVHDRKHLTVYLSKDSFSQEYYLSIMEYYIDTLGSKPILDYHWQLFKSEPHRLKALVNLLRKNTSNLAIGFKSYPNYLLSKLSQPLTNHELVSYLEKHSSAKYVRSPIFMALSNAKTEPVSPENLQFALTLQHQAPILLFEQLKMANRNNDITLLTNTARNLLAQGIINANVITAHILAYLIDERFVIRPTDFLNYYLHQSLQKTPPDSPLTVWQKEEDFIQRLGLFSKRGELAMLLYNTIHNHLKFNPILITDWENKLDIALKQSRDPLVQDGPSKAKKLLFPLHRIFNYLKPFQISSLQMPLLRRKKPIPQMLHAALKQSLSYEAMAVLADYTIDNATLSFNEKMYNLNLSKSSPYVLAALFDNEVFLFFALLKNDHLSIRPLIKSQGDNDSFIPLTSKNVDLVLASTIAILYPFTHDLTSSTVIHFNVPTSQQYDIFNNSNLIKRIPWPEAPLASKLYLLDPNFDFLCSVNDSLKCYKSTQFRMNSLFALRIKQTSNGAMTIAQMYYVYPQANALHFTEIDPDIYTPNFSLSYDGKELLPWITHLMETDHTIVNASQYTPTQSPRPWFSHGLNFLMLGALIIFGFIIQRIWNPFQRQSKPNTQLAGILKKITSIEQASNAIQIQDIAPKLSKQTRQQPTHSLEERIDALNTRINDIKKTLNQLKFKDFIEGIEHTYKSLSLRTTNDSQKKLRQRLFDFANKIASAKNNYDELVTLLKQLDFETHPKPLTLTFVDAYQIKVESSGFLLKTLRNSPWKFEELKVKIEKINQHDLFHKTQLKAAHPSPISKDSIKNLIQIKTHRIALTKPKNDESLQQAAIIHFKKQKPYVLPEKIKVYLYDINIQATDIMQSSHAFHSCIYSLIRAVECLIHYNDPHINRLSFKTLRNHLKNIYLLPYDQHLLLTDFCKRFMNGYRDQNWNWANEALITQLLDLAEARHAKQHLLAIDLHISALDIMYKAQLVEPTIAKSDPDSRQHLNYTLCHIMFLDSCFVYLKNNHYHCDHSLISSIRIIRNYIWHENEFNVREDEIWQILSNVLTLRTINITPKHRAVYPHVLSSSSGTHVRGTSETSEVSTPMNRR